PGALAPWGFPEESRARLGRGRVRAIEPESPFVLPRLALAQPMHVGVFRLPREGEHVGSDPRLDREPRAAGRLAEIRGIGDLDIDGPAALERGVRVARDGARLRDDGGRAIGPVIAIGRRVEGRGPRYAPQPPVGDRALGQDCVAVPDAHRVAPVALGELIPDRDGPRTSCGTVPTVRRWVRRAPFY